MKKLFLKVAFLSLLIFSIFSCKNNTPEEKTGSITGKVTLNNSETESFGFTVCIAGYSYSCITDEDGSFNLIDIPVAENYKIVIIKNDFMYMWKKDVAVIANEQTDLGTINFTSEEIKKAIEDAKGDEYAPSKNDTPADENKKSNDSDKTDNQDPPEENKQDDSNDSDNNPQKIDNEPETTGLNIVLIEYDSLFYDGISNKVKRAGYILKDTDFPELSHEGYTFIGWDKEPGFVVTEDIVITALWEENQSGMEIEIPEKHNILDIEISKRQNNNIVTYSVKKMENATYRWFIDNVLQQSNTYELSINTASLSPANYRINVIVQTSDKIYTGSETLKIVQEE